MWAFPCIPECRESCERLRIFLRSGARLCEEISAVSRHGVIEFVLPLPFGTVFYSLDDLILLLHPWHWAVDMTQNRSDRIYKTISPLSEKTASSVSWPLLDTVEPNIWNHTASPNSTDIHIAIRTRIQVVLFCLLLAYVCFYFRVSC